MSLKVKTLLIVLTLMTLYAAIHGLIHRYIILPEFHGLEMTDAEQNIRRPVLAIDRELFHLGALTQDWATWDDTYNFMVTRSPGYIKSNLEPLDTFVVDNLNLLYLCDLKGEVVWHRNIDLDTKKTITIPEIPEQFFPVGHPLISFGNADHSYSATFLKGIMMTSRGPLLLAARHIYTSSSKGPSRGTLIMGRFITDKVVKAMVDQTEVPFELIPLTKGMAATLDSGVNDLVKGKVKAYFDKRNLKVMTMYTVIQDFTGKPALLVKAFMNRDILNAGYETMEYILITIVISGFLLGVILLFLLHATILGPVSVLKNHARAVEESGDLSSRLNMNKSDEIGDLARSFDKMLESLAQVRDELLDQSYYSGLAGMTSDILHNAGNIMMPLSQKMNRIQHICHQIPMTNSKTAIEELVKGVDDPEREEKLKRYLQLSIKEMGYVVEDSGNMLEEISGHFHEMERMLGDLERFCRSGKVLRDLVPETLIHQAVSQIPECADGQCSVSIDPNMGDLPLLKAEPVVLGRVFSTVLGQAVKFACERDDNNAMIRINGRMEKMMGGVVIHFMISDNGPEQDKADLKKLFERQYSGKSREMLFSGFHWCGNVVSAMKGMLDIQSTKEGTEFHITLPVGGKV